MPERDGLYTIHDRANKKVGFGKTANCPNEVESTKVISSIKSTKHKNWCNCLSDTQRQDSTLRSYWPFSSPCYFWFWWTYLILVSVGLILLMLCFLCVACCRRKKKAGKKYIRNNYLNDLI